MLSEARRPKILVVGDVMLDRYLWGDAGRISPEAPVPVLKVSRTEHRLGGAGSVAAMLSALEAEVSLAAVVGDDAEGRIIADLLHQIGVRRQSVLADPTRATTVKERLLGRTQSRYAQQMIRVDREDTQPMAANLADQMLRLIQRLLQDVELVLVSDYDKGVCAGDFVAGVVSLARSAGVPVVADPVRSADYSRYAGCFCITPNRTEAAIASGMEIHSWQHGLEAARRLLEFGVDVAAVTLDRDGIVWADRQGRSQHVPCRPREICDITGAGDMVISALGYALAMGADPPAAIELANLAGGLEVERLGVVPLSRRELLAEFSPDVAPSDRKILPSDRLDAELERRRQRGDRIVMTNGCFDLLHPGHVASLKAARALGDCLLVGLNSDRSVREIKGPERPIVDQQGRAEMLAALACVDYVVIFEEASVEGLVGRVLPDVLVKAAEYSVQQVVGHEIVKRNGGQVVLAPLESSYSTTELIRKISSLADAKPMPRKQQLDGKTGKAA